MTETTVMQEFDKRKHEVAQIAEKYHVGKLSVFGSFARGEAQQNSDIDLLADVSHLRWGEYLDFCEELERLFGRKVEVLSEGVLDTEFGKYIRDDLEAL